RRNGRVFKVRQAVELWAEQLRKRYTEIETGFRLQHEAEVARWLDVVGQVIRYGRVGEIGFVGVDVVADGPRGHGKIQPALFAQADAVRVRQRHVIGVQKAAFVRRKFCADGRM